MGHPDFKDLMEAKTRMANVAKDINEYTKRLDLSEFLERSFEHEAMRTEN